jgi:GMP reductase
MHIDSEIKLDFCDVLIKPKRSTLESRSQVKLVKTFNPKYGNPFSGTGIIASNMLTGTPAMYTTLSKYNCFTAFAKHYSGQFSESQLEYGFYTIGMKNDSELGQLKAFWEQIDNSPYLKICVDVANGYQQRFSDYINRLRDHFYPCVIVAGNVCTPEMVQELVIAGADYVKVGIGPGNACRTRLKAGVGYPQLSAIIECSDAAHGLGAGIVADGGIRSAGDVAKAFCGNADMVMIGSMLAGTNECDGECITKRFESDELEWDNGQYKKKIIEKEYKLFYGMSSDLAQKNHFGGIKDYRTSEGSVEEYECKGSASLVIEDILGGLRSTGTYIGARSLKDFGKCATFTRVSRQHDRF